jgi:hypothetical protein
MLRMVLRNVNESIHSPGYFILQIIPQRHGGRNKYRQVGIVDERFG